MQIIKVHTTHSTNDFLKDHLRHNDAKNFTTIWAFHQTAGKGQRGNTWTSEAGKNLTFSILINFKLLKLQSQFLLNQAVSLAMLDVLKELIPQVQIKWPNDIMADEKKLAGILIENTIQGNFIKNSVVGIGLNVNQKEFDDKAPNAIAIIHFLDKEHELEKILIAIQKAIVHRMQQLENENPSQIYQEYLQNLMGWQIFRTYTLPNATSFEAKITGVSQDGKLILENKQQQIHEFAIKEVSCNL